MKKVNLTHKVAKILLTSIGGFLLLVLPFQIRSVHLAEAQNSQYEFSKTSIVYFKQVTYHKEINDFFNKKIAKLRSQEGSLKPADGKNCKDNVTTYCVAQEATEMFFQYKEELLAQKDNLTEEMAKASGDNFQRRLVELNSQKVSGIEEELEKAEKTLDMTIQAYNEMQIAYPLHVQYQDMIDNLETYRYQLESIQGLTENFPKVFVNATTTSCT